MPKKVSRWRAQEVGGGGYSPRRRPLLTSPTLRIDHAQISHIPSQGRLLFKGRLLHRMLHTTETRLGFSTLLPSASRRTTLSFGQKVSRTLFEPFTFWRWRPRRDTAVRRSRTALWRARCGSPPLHDRFFDTLDDVLRQLCAGFVHVPFRAFPAVTITGQLTIHVSASGVLVRPRDDPEHLRFGQALAMALVMVLVAETLGMMREERCHSDSGGQQRCTRMTRSRHRYELLLLAVVAV